MTTEQDRAPDTGEMWLGETEPTVKGEAAAAICGHSALMISNAEELDEFHGFVQIQLEHAYAEAFDAGVAAAIAALRDHAKAMDKNGWQFARLAFASSADWLASNPPRMP